MSDALDYLVKARPDALAPYLKFMKEAGKHLDPKTRDLISVITKVHAQTERGLRQYLMRALRASGAPPPPPQPPASGRGPARAPARPARPSCGGGRRGGRRPPRGGPSRCAGRAS